MILYLFIFIAGIAETYFSLPAPSDTAYENSTYIFLLVNMLTNFVLAKLVYQIIQKAAAKQRC